MKISFINLLNNLCPSESDRSIFAFLESTFNNQYSGNVQILVNNLFWEHEEDLELLDELLLKIKKNNIHQKSLNLIKYLVKIADSLRMIEFFGIDSEESNFLLLHEKIIAEIKKNDICSMLDQNFIDQFLNVSAVQNIDKEIYLGSFVYMLNSLAVIFLLEKDETKFKALWSKIKNIAKADDDLSMLIDAIYIDLMTIRVAFKNLNPEVDSSLRLTLLTLGAQFAIYYCEYHNNLLINILGNISLDPKEILIPKWHKLHLKFKDLLNSSKSIYGIGNVLEKMGLEVEEINDKATQLMQIIQLKIVEIKEIKPHPASDRLNLCTIFDGHKYKEIVCGAGNVHNIKNNNYKTIYADLGCLLPNGILIEPRDIRGVISHGMLCSLDEINAHYLSDYDGIAEISSTAMATSGVAPINYILNNLNLHSLLDLSVTPNLGYLLGEANIAIHLHAYISDHIIEIDSPKTTIKNTRLTIAKNLKDVFANIIHFEIGIDNYRLTKDMQDQLMITGYKIENSLKDLVNFYHLIHGCYFHAFDSDKITGKLTIKKAEENIQNILQDDLIICDEAQKTIALAGIADFDEFTVNKESKKLLLIGFVFHSDEKNWNKGYESILPTIRREKINNEMTYFYERGVINLPLLAGNNLNNKTLCIVSKYQATKLINFKLYDFLMLYKKDMLVVFNLIEAASTIMQTIDQFSPKEKKRMYAELLSEQEKIDGFMKEVVTLLFVLFATFNLSVKESNRDKRGFYIYDLKIPNYRNDIHSSVDLVAAFYKLVNYREIVCITNDNKLHYFSSYIGFPKAHQCNEEIHSDNHLYNECSAENLKENFSVVDYGEYKKLNLVSEISQNLVVNGYKELCSFSFMDEQDIFQAIPEKYIVKLTSPINQNLNILRPSILPNLLNNFVEISKTGLENISLFEIGSIYSSYNIFNKVIAGLRGGSKIPRNVNVKSEDSYSFFDIKGDIISAVSHYNITEDNLEFIGLDDFYTSSNSRFIKILENHKLIAQDEQGEYIDQHKNFFHPGKSAVIFYLDRSQNKYLPLGYCGEIHPQILKKFNLTEKGILIGFTLFHQFLNIQKLEPLFNSAYQAVGRDFALIFDENIKIGDIKKTIFHANHNQLLRDLKFFDIYQNEELKNEGKKSVAFNIKLQSNEKTLGDKEITEVVNNILGDIKKELGGIFSFDRI